MNQSANDTRTNPGSQGFPVAFGNIGAELLFELFGTRGTGLGTSNPKVGSERLVAECADFFHDLGGFDRLDNVIPEPNRALIHSKPDVAAHRHASKFLSVRPQPASWLERHKHARRLSLRE